MKIWLLVTMICFCGPLSFGSCSSDEDARQTTVERIKQRGKAERGEKTMLDAIIPAYEAYCAAADAGKGLDECLEAMCEAAKEGVEYTKTIRATKGRASYLGDRSIGHQDPGATSSLLTMEAIRDFCK